MVSDTAARVVHEAEAQRQHVRLKIPVQIELGDAILRTADWSVSGFGIAMMDRPVRVGDVYEVRLVVPFENFEFASRLKCEVRHVGERGARVGFRYVDLNRQQLSFLQYICDAFVSGEVVYAGDILDVSSRNMFVTPRKIPPKDSLDTPLAKFAKRLRRAGSIIATFLIAFGIFAYAAFALYNRLFVTSAEGFVVTPQMEVVRAGISGILTPYSAAKGKAVTAKELIGVIEGPDGSSRPLEAVCDCFLANEPLPGGSYVTRGAIVARLIPRNAQADIEVRLPLERVRGIKKGNRASIGLFSEAGVIWGIVTRVELHTPIDISAPSAAAGAFGILSIKPDKALPLQLAGEPASVKVHRLVFGAG